MSIPEEILKKVKLLELRTRRLVNNLFAGEYQTAFKGQGMTFAEFREYYPGDDVRHISWTLTARAGKPFIKKFDEEREQTLILALDISGSTDFGSQKYFKGEVLTHLSALLAFSAAKNKDPVGLLLFSDQVELYVPPKKGRGHIQRLLRDMYYHKPKSSGTQLGAAVHHLQSVLKKRANIFILSDFLDQGFESTLRSLSKKHDVTAVVVHDPLEELFPQLGLVHAEDAETGELLFFDSGSREFFNLYQGGYKQLASERDAILRRAQVPVVRIKCGEDFVGPLLEYFKKRRAR